jgi:hypothetical protein
MIDVFIRFVLLESRFVTRARLTPIYENELNVFLYCFFRKRIYDLRVRFERGSKMQGIMCFPTIEEAVRAGFTLYDRTAGGYIVRQRTPGGWALAIVGDCGR